MPRTRSSRSQTVQTVQKRLFSTDTQQEEQPRVRKNISILIGGGALACLIAYLYCENNPQVGFCKKVRRQLHLPPSTNLPKVAKNASQRENPLKNIKELFEIGHLGDQKRVEITVLGDPGSGKTELSTQFANCKASQYSKVFTIDASSKEAWQEKYKQLARQLDPSQRDDLDVDLAVKIVHDHLQSSHFWLKHKRPLLIFDRVNEQFFRDFLIDIKLPPSVPIDVLFTTRSMNVRRGEVVSLNNNQIDNRLTLLEGKEILKKWVPASIYHEAEAEKIVVFFNFNPLALAQAGIYLEDGTTAIERYLPLFKEEKEKNLKQGAIKNTEVSPNTWAAVQMNLNKLEENDPEALLLLSICCCIPSKQISRNMLRKLFPDETKLMNLQRTLISKSFLEEMEATDVSVSSLTQEVLMKAKPKVKEKAIETILSTVSPDDYLEFFIQNPKKSLETFKEGVNLVRQTGSPQKIAKALLSIGKLLAESGQYSEAYNHFKEAVDLWESNVSENERMHPDFAEILSHLGIALSEMKQYENAESYLKRAIDIFNVTKTNSHRSIEPLSYLGNYYMSVKKDFKEALKCFEPAWGKCRKLYGYTPRLQSAQLLMNMGMCYAGVENNKKTIFYLEKSKGILEQLLGNMPEKEAEKHYVILLFLLGNTYVESKSYEKGIGCLERFLSLLSKEAEENKKTGEGVPYLDALMIAYTNSGNAKKAVEYSLKHLNEVKKIYGNRSNESVAHAYTCLGRAYRLDRDLDKALQNLNQSLKMYHAVYSNPPFHPSKASVLKELGLTYNDKGDTRNAILYLEQSLEMFKKSMVNMEISASSASAKMILQFLQQISEINSILKELKIKQAL